MKKIYLFLVMCSISMVAFAQGANCVASVLQTGVHPEIAGTGYVVRSSTIQNGDVQCGMQNMHTYSCLSHKQASLYTSSNGWLAANNLNAITGNNTACSVPGAGFLTPSNLNNYGEAEAENDEKTNAAALRFFAFEIVSVKRVTNCHQQAPVIIYGPSKSITYV